MYQVVDTETTGLNMYKGDLPFATIFKDPITDEINYRDMREPGWEEGFAYHYNSPSFEKVFHNAKFDIQMLQEAGYAISGNFHDTLIMAHVYNPDEPSKKLKVLAKKYLGIEPEEETALKDFIRQNKIPAGRYDLIPQDILQPYAVKDVEITWKLFNFYKDQGVLDNPVYKTEMRLMRALIFMQRRGVRIDTEYTQGMIVYCDKRLKDIDNDIAVRWGEINTNSNKQLGEFLFDKEGLTCDAYSDAGNPILDEAMLKTYEHPIVPLILEKRFLEKMRATYFQGFLDNCDAEGVIHCDLYQVGAKTGRFSCRQPNLQNIGREPKHGVDVRKAFVCREGYDNYYFDYSQIELRILAHYCQDTNMLNILKTGGDIHSETAKGIFGEDFTKEQRYIAKRINFGIVYGIGPAKFVKILNAEMPDSNYTYQDAFRFINAYHATYPMVKPFIYAVQRKILSRGYVKDIYDRKYPCPKEFAYKGVNYLIQGCAAGVLKNAMVKVYDLLKGKRSNILLSIHDEIIVEVHADEQDIVPQIKELMEDRNTFRVPILVDVEKTSSHWSAKEEVEVV